MFQACVSDCVLAMCDCVSDCVRDCVSMFQACVRDCVSDCVSDCVRDCASVSGMHSFGLHSPDMLPVADVDFQTMGDVDLNHLPPEVYQAIYHPDTNMIPAQKLYFDPDIIGKRLYASILLPSWHHSHRQKSVQ